VTTSDAHGRSPGDGQVTVFLPVARSKALVRGMLLGVAAALLGMTAGMIYVRIDFAAPGVSGRIVPASLAVLMFPFVIATFAVGNRAGRWLLLAGWPGPIGVFASPAELELRLGPFGTRSFDAAGLRVRYPFELSDEEAAGTFEAFLPEEEQIASFLPQIRHEKESVNRTILRFVGASEPDVASALRPVLEVWRGKASQQSDCYG